MQKTIKNNLIRASIFTISAAFASTLLFACVPNADNTNMSNTNNTNLYKETETTTGSDIDLSSLPLSKEEYYALESYTIHYSDENINEPLLYEVIKTLNNSGNTEEEKITLTYPDQEPSIENYVFSLAEQGRIESAKVSTPSSTSSTQEDFYYKLDDTSTGFVLEITESPVMSSNGYKKNNDIELPTTIIRTYNLDSQGTLGQYQKEEIYESGTTLKTYYTYAAEGEIIEIRYDNTYQYDNEEIQAAQEEGRELPNNTYQSYSLSYDKNNIIITDDITGEMLLLECEKDGDNNITKMEALNGKVVIDFTYDYIIDGNLLGYINSVTDISNSIYKMMSFGTNSKTLFSTEIEIPETTISDDETTLQDDENNDMIDNEVIDETENIDVSTIGEETFPGETITIE